MVAGVYTVYVHVHPIPVDSRACVSSVSIHCSWQLMPHAPHHCTCQSIELNLKSLYTTINREQKLNVVIMFTVRLFKLDTTLCVPFFFQGGPGNPGVPGITGKPGKPGDTGNPVSAQNKSIIL